MRNSSLYIAPKRKCMQLTEVFKWRMPIKIKTFRLDKRLQHIYTNKGWLPHLQTCECWGIDLTGATSQRCISIDFGKRCTWSHVAKYRFVLKTVRKGALCLTELSNPIFLFTYFLYKICSIFSQVICPPVYRSCRYIKTKSVKSVYGDI